MGGSSAGGGANETGGCLKQKCSHPHFIPEWMPSSLELVPIETRLGRAFVFLFSLIYIFVGLSLVADIFYSSIDMMVSKKRKVRVFSRVTSTWQYVSIPVWNETVAHFTMFVLGTCAPEIALSVIETIMMNFQMGEVGPMVILGSAFNLFLTAGICVQSAKTAKKQHELPIFFLTVGWAAFAYGWLYVILVPSSEGVIEVWEAVFTVAFFPIMVVTAYTVDRKFFGFFKKLPCLPMHKARASEVPRANRIAPSQNKDGTDSVADNISVIAEDGTSPPSDIIISPAPSEDASVDFEKNEGSVAAIEMVDENGKPFGHDVLEAVKQLEYRQNRFLSMVKSIRLKHPNMLSSKIYELAELAIIDEMPKSISYYRMMASKGRELLNKNKLRGNSERFKVKRFERPNEQLISFDPVEYHVMEDCGVFQVNVIREGEQLQNTVSVNFSTEDGTGVAGSDYVHTKGKLVFKPREKMKHIPIKILDDDVFNLDTQFYVNLFDTAVVDRGSRHHMLPDVKLDPDLRRATITKMDDDHGGIFQFEDEKFAIEEDVGVAKIKILRDSGAKGDVSVPYRIFTETAIPGVHYCEQEDSIGIVKFNEKETEQYIVLSIVNEQKLEKTVTFRIELSDPFWAHSEDSEDEEEEDNDDAMSMRSGRSGKSDRAISMRSGRSGKTDRTGGAKSAKSKKSNTNNRQKSGNRPGSKSSKSSHDRLNISQLGKPRLGEITAAVVFITENARLKKAVENISNIDLSELVSSTSWSSQFADALHVYSSSNVDDDDTASNKEDSMLSIKSKPSIKDYLSHYVTLLWKILFAMIPPTTIWRGVASFVISFIFIAGLMALAGDCAIQLGCAIGLKIEMTAVTFIAMGVSLPDIFASKLAATKEEHADAAIGHMMGRIPVSIFVGFGLSWTIASIKSTVDGNVLTVTVTALPFNVILFCLYAGIVIAILLLRRLPPIRGELGGPRGLAVITAIIFFVLWLSYFLLFALVSYCVMRVF